METGGKFRKVLSDIDILVETLYLIFDYLREHASSLNAVNVLREELVLSLYLDKDSCKR